jgi:hypothetical protein
MRREKFSRRGHTEIDNNGMERKVIVVYGEKQGK